MTYRVGVAVHRAAAGVAVAEPVPDVAGAAIHETLQRHEIKDGDEVPVPFPQGTDLLRKRGKQSSLNLALLSDWRSHKEMGLSPLHLVFGNSQHQQQDCPCIETQPSTGTTAPPVRRS